MEILFVAFAIATHEKMFSHFNSCSSGKGWSISSDKRCVMASHLKVSRRIRSTILLVSQFLPWMGDDIGFWLPILRSIGVNPTAIDELF